MLTRTVVTQDDGTPYEALMIAPLSVVLDYRNQGVGSALLKEGLRLAQSRVTGQLFFAAIRPTTDVSVSKRSENTVSGKPVCRKN